MGKAGLMAGGALAAAGSLLVVSKRLSMSRCQTGLLAARLGCLLNLPDYH